MKIKNKYHLFCLAFWFCSNLFAQEDQIVVKRVAFPNDGTEVIISITQDSTGLVWMMGRKSLYTSDGEKVIPIPLFAEEILKLKIKGIFQGAPDGNLYLGGDSLRIFNPYERKIVQSIGIDEKYIPDGKPPLLFLFLESSKGTIWTLLTSHGINDKNQLVSGDNAVMVSRNGAPFQLVHNSDFQLYSEVIVVRENELFLSSEDTIWQYDIKGNLIKFQALPGLSSKPLKMKNEVESNEPVQFLHFVQNQSTGAFERAIYELEPDSDKFKAKAFPELNEVECFSINKVGDHYWIKGMETILHHVSLKDKKVTDYSKYVLQQFPDLSYFNSYFTHVFEDHTGTIWLTTYNGWVLKLSSIKSPFKRFLAERRQYSFCENGTCIIRGITSDTKGNIYFAYDYGIHKLDTQSGRLSPVTLNLKEPLEGAYSLTYYNEHLYFNDLQINPETGMVKYLIEGANGGERAHFIDKGKGIIWLSDTYWVNPSISIYKYDLKQEKGTKIGLIEEPRKEWTQVSQFLPSTTTNTMYMATLANGLCEMDSNGNISQFITAEKSRIKSDSIWATYTLYEDKYQRLWIGHSDGLSLLNLKSREFIRTPHNGYVTTQDVYSILPENDSICWLGTGRGINRLNIETGLVQNLHMFPSQSGKEFNRFAAHQASDGMMYFGSLEGLFAFDTDELVREALLNERFQVQLSQFSIFDVKKDTIIHSYDYLANKSTFDIFPQHKYFSFEVFVPDFRDAEKNTYTWKLEGYDSRWSAPSTSNTIRYDNLPSGAYTLHVKGGISSDYYDSSQRQFQIIVHQVWYNRGWAWGLYITTILSLFYLIYKYKVRQQLEKAEVQRKKELERLKSRLYTNITHEFRTPLTVILGMVDNIRGNPKEKKLIYRNSQNLLRLVNQLLDLSKLHSGHMKIEAVQADIINYLQYLTESFHSMAEEKKIRLLFYSEIKELDMDFDDVKIQHIIYNLLSNAIKFSKPGAKVVLHATTEERNGVSNLKLKVSDTGIGIQETELEHIFDRFYQADGTNTRKGEGTGIGLALTKELVELMEGTITVESQVGEGTVFLIVLPIKRDQETPQMETEMAATRKIEEDLVSEMPFSPPATKGEHLPANQMLREGGGSPLGVRGEHMEKSQLLIIEDNPDVRTYLFQLLNNDYQISTAENGQLGIEKALETIPDIIISDVMMPEKDGYEVCQILKSDERTSHIPIILLTAKATSKDRIDGLKGGADAYLTKPFDKEELFVRLEKLVAIRKALLDHYSKKEGFAKALLSKQAASLDDLFLQKLIKVVQDRLDDPDLAVVHLCRAAQLSNAQVNRKLKALLGKTPSQFIRSIRLQKAVELLKTTDLNISEIAYDVGFSDPNYFSRSFSEEFGHPPNAMRK